MEFHNLNEEETKKIKRIRQWIIENASKGIKVLFIALQAKNAGEFIISKKILGIMKNEFDIDISTSYLYRIIKRLRKKGELRRIDECPNCGEKLPRRIPVKCESCETTLYRKHESQGTNYQTLPWNLYGITEKGVKKIEALKYLS